MATPRQAPPVLNAGSEQTFPGAEPVEPSPHFDRSLALCTRHDFYLASLVPELRPAIVPPPTPPTDGAARAVATLAAVGRRVDAE